MTDFTIDTEQADQLGGGLDLAGKRVLFAGHIWTIVERNYLGDWDIERFEERSEGRFRIGSSISATVLPEANRHFAKLIETDEPGCQASE